MIEKTLFQVVACNRHGSLTRPFPEPFADIVQAEQKAQEAIKHPDATEVFVVTIHSAFRKAYTVERTA